ncbi:MAG: hypothetical protein K6B70_07535 [Clostridia bacterium]|nr:hypothetical protein [Clostridia bacterium]
MKKRVHYAYLEDMEKYIKGFNPDDYESCGDQSDPSVIEYARDYYAKHLPVDVTAWIRVNEPDENLIYAKGLGDQVCFVRDTLHSLLTSTYEEWLNNPPMVISTHCSKSVKLPVYQINLEKYGIEIILRYNFYDWKVSIKSERPLEFDFMGLFDPKKEISELCCEGFPEEKVYGCYEKDHSQFTFEIVSRYDLYTYIFLLKNYLGIKNED